MTHQVWGPFVNLVGNGGYRAWTIGEWFVLKYSNLLMFLLVALLFIIGMFIHLPEQNDQQ